MYNENEHGCTTFSRGNSPLKRDVRDFLGGHAAKAIIDRVLNISSTFRNVKVGVANV